MITSNEDLNDKKWNGEQSEKKSEVNEGFSGKNLSEDYNPAKGKLKTEVEKDDEGNSETVKRARDVEDYDTNQSSGNDIKNQKKPENRDRNSDSDPNRYSDSNAENKKDRGNMKLDE